MTTITTNETAAIRLAVELAEMDTMPASNPYALAAAHLVGINADGNPVELDRHPDVYQLLNNENNQFYAQWHELVAIITTGWAAPITPEITNGDMAPSCSPDRRRVRLTIIADRTAYCSVIMFEDGETDPVYDPGTATGALAEAVRIFFGLDA